jgi:hypothetical protein
MSVKPPKPMQTGEYPSSRAILALVFGILGLLSMGLFAIPAWILGKAERQAIERGASPEAGAAWQRRDTFWELSVWCCWSLPPCSCWDG